MHIIHLFILSFIYYMFTECQPCVKHGSKCQSTALKKEESGMYKQLFPFKFKVHVQPKSNGVRQWAPTLAPGTSFMEAIFPWAGDSRRWGGGEGGGPQAVMWGPVFLTDHELLLAAAQGFGTTSIRYTSVSLRTQNILHIKPVLQGINLKLN